MTVVAALQSGADAGADAGLGGPADVGTATVVVIGATMFAVLSLRLAYLAIRTRERVARPQAALWEYFAFAGVVGVLYSGLTLVQLWAGIPLRFLDGLLLAFALLFALAVREGYFNATLSNAERDRLGEYRARRSLEVGLVGIVVVVAVGPLVRPEPAFALLTAAAAVVVVGYGAYFQVRRTSEPATRGTLIDTLLRQSVPVLVFAGGALVAPALELGPLRTDVAAAVAAVFVVVTAASLMTVTIKLRQHISSHR